MLEQHEVLKPFGKAILCLNNYFIGKKIQVNFFSPNMASTCNITKLKAAFNKCCDGLVLVHETAQRTGFTY